MKYYIYDIETLPNIFTMWVKIAGENKWWSCEISTRKNEYSKFWDLMTALGEDEESIMVGYNNLHFDYPIIHMMLRMGHVGSAKPMYDKKNAIFDTPFNEPFRHSIWESDWYVPQLDLLKMNHYDNPNRRTSLKDLEFNMNMTKIDAFELDFDKDLDVSDFDKLLEYNKHDIRATELFFDRCRSAVDIRHDLTAKTGINHLNWSDTTIGEKQFVRNLEDAGISLYDYDDRYGNNYMYGVTKTKKGTPRPDLELSTCLLEDYQFKTPSLQQALVAFKGKIINERKDAFKGMCGELDGLKVPLGVGGTHISVSNQSFESDDKYTIEDWDVESYYPSLAIANGLYPEHLGEAFVKVYADMKNDRTSFKKGTPENAMLKLALNGAYGKSLSKHSVLYDPKFGITVTVNGQLLMYQLCENLLDVPGLKLLQVNTDGLTIRYPRIHTSAVQYIMDEWQLKTKLKLEKAVYDRMIIRDVNNYIAIYEDGTLKTKGAYSYDLQLHQNFSGLVIAKVAQEVLINNVNIEEALIAEWHKDTSQFMMKVKSTGKSYHTIDDVKIQKVSRYYVSRNGGVLEKHMPPLKKMVEQGKTDWRVSFVGKGYLVKLCNDTNKAGSDLNLDYYISEVEKLTMEIK